MDELSGEFKFATEDWSTIDLGAPKDTPTTPAAPGVSYQLADHGANIPLTNSLGACRLTVNIKNKTLLIEDKTLGITSPLADKGLTITGRTIKCAGAIRVYNATGELVAEGKDNVQLPCSGLFVVVTGTGTYKLTSL